MLNAIGFRAVQGVPLSDLAPKDFAYPIPTWTTSQFLTARAVARHMVKNRRGVILTLSASPARLAIAMTGGFGVGLCDGRRPVPHAGRPARASRRARRVYQAASHRRDIGRCRLSCAARRIHWFSRGHDADEEIADTGRCRQYGGVPRFGSRGGHVLRGGKLDLRDERRLAACAVSAMSCTWCWL